MRRVLGLLALLAIASACTAPAATPSPTPPQATTAAPTAAATASTSPAPNPNLAPALPAPVAVTLDPKSTALVVLDIINPTCSARPACNDSIPAIQALIKKARDASVPVVYTNTAAANAIVPQVAPAAGDVTVVPTNADKFNNPDFDATFKAKKVTTLLLVGTRANGAVLYTAFEANVRGYTVVVAVDGISGSIPFETTVAEWQMLNQPGFTNADNKPLAEKLVTLSRGDLITFK
ncbi:MAG TPA: cysteine hydrolase [Candidatus Saccharimonadales bacterium]|nr:cysteine hydrolase [Candidatus Saccharimonadales bacterium]